MNKLKTIVFLLCGCVVVAIVIKVAVSPRTHPECSSEMPLQEGIRIINADYRHVDFGLTTHDLEERVHLSDSVNELRPEGDMLEMRQTYRGEYLCWLRNHHSYTVTGCSQNFRINLRSEYPEVDHEIRFFAWLDSCLYPACPLESSLPLERFRYLKNDSLEIVERAVYEQSVLLLNEYDRLFPVSERFKAHVLAWFELRYVEAKIWSFLRFSRLKEPEKCEKYKELLCRDSVLFTRDSLLFMSRYRNVASMYCDFLAQLNTGKMKSSAEEKYQVAKAGFQGRTRDYLLFSLYCGLLSSKNKSVSSIHFEQDCRDSVWLREIRSLSVFREAAGSHVGCFWRSDGQIVSWEELLSSWKGKRVFIDCWASWCEPCRELMPASRAFAKEFEGKDVVFVYFSFDKDIVRWQEACRQEGLEDNRESYCVLAPKEFQKQWQFKGIPYSILLDEKGQVLLKQMQTADYSKVKKILASCFNEAFR